MLTIQICDNNGWKKIAEEKMIKVTHGKDAYFLEQNENGKLQITQFKENFLIDNMLSISPINSNKIEIY